MDHPIIYLMVSLAIAFFSSWLTVLLSLSRFRKEKLWEQKLEIYKSIIERLYDLKRYFIVDEDEILGARVISSTIY